MYRYVNQEGPLLCQFIHRGSWSLQNLVAIFQRYNQPVLTSTAGCMGKDGKIGYSIQGLVAKVKDTVANG